MKQRFANYLRLAIPAFLVLWTLSTVIELVQLYQKREVLVLITDGRQLLADFNAFYNAAVLCRHHFEQATPMYDIATQAASLAAVIAPQKSDVIMLAVYPPHFFLLVEPLSYLSVYNAWLVWSGLGILSLIAAIYLLDLKQIKSRYERICCVIGFIGTSTTFSTIRHGQNSFMLLACMLVFWRLLEARKFFLAGLSVALCMFKPQYLPSLCTVGLIVGRWRFAAGAFLAALFVGGISLAVFGWPTIKAWAGFVQIGETHPDVAYLMQNIRGQITILMHGRAADVGPPLLTFILLASLLFLAWLWYRFRNQLLDPIVFRLLAAITTSAVLFCSPHTHINDYVLFYVTAIWTWTYMTNKKVSGLANSILKGLLITYPYASWFFLLLSALFLLVRIQPFLAWNLAVFALSLLMLLQTSATTSALPGPESQEVMM